MQTMREVASKFRNAAEALEALDEAMESLVGTGHIMHRGRHSTNGHAKPMKRRHKMGKLSRLKITAAQLQRHGSNPSRLKSVKQQIAELSGK